MRWWLILLIPTVAGQPLITGVVPDLPGAGGEGVGVTSPTNWTLSGYSLTDGETVWHFPDGASLVAGEEAWAVSDIARWAEYDGPAPRWKMTLNLANAGDQVMLLGPNGTVDAMAYGKATVAGMVGSAPISGAALVLKRSVDTDHQRDWQTPRTHRLGESNLEAPRFWAESVTAFSSPDNSHKVLVEVMQEAAIRLHLHVYQLSGQVLIDELVAAAGRGVDVQVLLEDRPVGLDSSESAVRDEAMRRLITAGANVTEAGSVRYKYHHLKVLVADESVVVISENWVETGVPEDPSWGNRGWGAVLQSQDMADWFADWMMEDRQAWDSKPAGPPPGAPLPRFAPAIGAYQPRAAVTVPGPILVEPFISPDHTGYPENDLVVAAIQAGQSSIDVQQLDLSLSYTNPLGWSAPDILLLELAAALDRGVEVRVQAAAPFRVDDTENRAALSWLAARGAKVSEMDAPGIVALHNKGLIIDGATVVLGSMNGNHHSRSNNREAGVIIHSQDVAKYYAELFEADWDPQPTRDWLVPARDVLALPISPWPMLLVVPAVAALRRCSQ